MSTIIIGGGGGKAAIDRAVEIGPRMTAEEQARVVQAETHLVAVVEEVQAAVLARAMS